MKQGPKSKHVRKIVNYSSVEDDSVEADLLKLNYDLDYLDEKERKNIVLNMKFIIRL